MAKFFKTTISLDVFTKGKPFVMDETFWNHLREAHADMDGVLLAGTACEEQEITRKEAGEAIEDLDERLEDEEVTCKFCGERCDAATAHLHQRKWVCDEKCWDERLRASE